MNDFSEDTFDIFNKMFESAKRIVTTFGEDTINVFKFEPKKLAQIKGITEARAEEMSKEFMKREEIVNEKRNQNVIDIEQKMTKMKIDIYENLEHSN